MTPGASSAVPNRRTSLFPIIQVAARITVHGDAPFDTPTLDLSLGGASLWFGPFDGNVLTSDSVRFARIANVVNAAPRLSLGGPTIGWLHAAIRQLRQFDDPKFPRATATPVLVIAAGADRVTDTAAVLSTVKVSGVSYLMAASSLTSCDPEK